MPLRLLIVCLAVLSLIHLGGCTGYTLHGQVVRGPYSMLTFVTPDDERLSDQGVGNVQVSIYRDPNQLNVQLAGKAVSAPDGSFIIPLDNFGAGLLEEQWRIVARRAQYRTAEDMINLPYSGDLILLVMLAPGQADQQRDDEDLMDVYREYR